MLLRGMGRYVSTAQILLKRLHLFLYLYFLGHYQCLHKQNYWRPNNYNQIHQW